MMFEFDDIFYSLQHGPLRDQCNFLKDALHQRSPTMTDIYKKLESEYNEKVKPLEIKMNAGKLVLQYIEEVESLLQFMCACRSGDWEGYISAL